MTWLKAPGRLILAMALVSALLLALPGATVTSAHVNDLLIFLDGAHRIAWNQTPNIDFHTALGPLVYYIPALGLWLTGSFGAALPLGMALVIAGFAPIVVHVLGSRLRPALALPLAAFLIVVLAAPINLGDRIAALSFAMFYNRIGWSALGLLLILYLRPTRPGRRQEGLDTLCAALLTLLQIYTKITYGAVAITFLAVLLLDARHRRWAALSLLLVLATATLVEMVWRGSWPHLQDLLATVEVSGGRNPFRILHNVLSNLASLTIFGLAAALALWLKPSPRDALFYGFCVAAGLLILNQNSQDWGLVTLYAGAAVAAETAMRAASGPALPADAHPPPKTSSHAFAAGAPLLLLLLLLPPTVHHAAALALHFALSLSGAGEPLGLRTFESVRYLPLWSPRDMTFTGRYVNSLATGAEALAGLDAAPGRVAVLDFVNPFSAGLGLQPPQGDSSWLHWNRNISAAHHPPPDQLFGDAALVMIPAIGVNSVPLQKLYGPYIEQHYDLIRETPEWKIYGRHPNDPGTSR